MSLIDRLVAVDRRLSSEQKVLGGSALLAAGVALVTLLVWLDVAAPLGVLVGLVAVALIVTGTLSLGTSGQSGGRVV